MPVRTQARAHHALCPHVRLRSPDFRVPDALVGLGAAVGLGAVAAQVVRHVGDHDPWSEQQRRLELQRGLVAQRLLPAAMLLALPLGEALSKGEG
jgi:hypothetical protein